jgi:hypothetical protein
MMNGSPVPDEDEPLTLPEHSMESRVAIDGFVVIGGVDDGETLTIPSESNRV